MPGQRRGELTVAGQQMRTSYLRPFSNARRRYQDSRPRGAELEGNCTGRVVATIERFAGSSVSRRRVARRGCTLGRVTGLGPRNIVFSTLALRVQACVTTMQSSAETRIFGGLRGRRAGSGAEAASFFSRVAFCDAMLRPLETGPGQLVFVLCCLGVVRLAALLLGCSCQLAVIAVRPVRPGTAANHRGRAALCLRL